MKKLFLNCAVFGLSCLAVAATRTPPQGADRPPQQGQQPPSSAQGQQPPSSSQGQQPPSSSQGQGMAQGGARGQSRPDANGGKPQRGGVSGRSGARGGAGAGRRTVRTLSQADQRLLEQIEDADSLSKLSRLMRQAQMSQTVEIRQAMVDALDGQGHGAANNLAAFIGDPDEDVADAAFSAWTSALEDMRPRQRALAIQSAAQLLQMRPGGWGQAQPGMPGVPGQGRR